LRQARTQLRQKTGPTPVASLSALARLLSSLAVLEQRDGKLNHGSLGAVTAAQKLGGSITGFVAGGNIKAVAEEAAKVNGIEKIIAIDNAAYDKVRTFDFHRLMDTNLGRDYPRTTLHCW
jgi:electron transfer flavoprotein alpha subunit